jgi:hypothetical protein
MEYGLMAMGGLFCIFGCVLVILSVAVLFSGFPSVFVALYDIAVGFILPGLFIGLASLIVMLRDIKRCR